MPRSLIVFLICLALPATAGAMVTVVDKPVRNNPADKLARLPIERPVYDRATRCSNKRQAGMTRMIGWLSKNAKGQFWGSYRCEKWGKRSASLHAENRAIDWHLDAAKAADKREATRLIRLLLAPDRAGNPQALARRMGVEEIIWDCGYWAAGMSEFKKYGPCRSRKVGKTIAHRDHIHIGMTKAGAAGKTSFWTRRAPSEDQVEPPRVQPDPVTETEADEAPGGWTGPNGGTGSGGDPQSGGSGWAEPEPEPDPDWDDDPEPSDGGYGWGGG